MTGESPVLCADGPDADDAGRAQRRSCSARNGAMKAKASSSTSFPLTSIYARDALEGTTPGTRSSCPWARRRLARRSRSICCPAVRAYIPLSRTSHPVRATLATGLVNPKCTGIIGNGVVLHVPSFFAELDALQNDGTCARSLSASIPLKSLSSPQDWTAPAVCSSLTVPTWSSTSTRSSMD